MKKLSIFASIIAVTTLSGCATASQPRQPQADEMHPLTKTAIICSAIAYNLSEEYKGINRYMENTYFAVSDKLLGAAGYKYDLEKAKTLVANTAWSIHEQNYSIAHLLGVFNDADNTALGMTCHDFYNSFSDDKLK